MTHQDFNMNGAHSYESVMTVIRRIIKIDPHLALEQQFKRAVFNVIGRNQDDHTKNIAFLMDKAGQWKLSPAYDMVYSYDPNGEWTSRHQMSINGKTENITREDLLALAEKADIKPVQAKKIIGEIIRVFIDIENELNAAGVFHSHILEIVRNIVLYVDER
jgi:serine/threonine-protein kinase HipA